MANENRFRVEPLHRRHDCASFDCLNIHENWFLARQARQHTLTGLSRTFVVVTDFSNFANAPLPTEVATQTPNSNPPGPFDQPDGNSAAILGYFTIAAGRLDLSNEPEPEQLEQLEQHGFGRSVPVVLVSHLAVDQRAVGRGLGRRLLIEAFERAARMTDVFAAVAVEVQARNGPARSFLTKHGFVPLADDEQRFWIAMTTIRRALS